MSAPAELAVVLATVQDFADRGGAERVVVLLDAEPPLMVERREDGALEVTEGEQAATAEPPRGRRAAAAGRPAAGAGERADRGPETGELAAPLGTVQLLVDSVLALARALGGRSVATATYATRDPALPLTVAAREGEPVVLDIGGRQFTFPA